MRPSRSTLGISVLISVITFFSLPAINVDASPTVQAFPAQAEPDTEPCRGRDVLLLMDQSISLRTSDPGGARTEGARALVDGIAAAGSNVKMSIAGFGNAVTEPKSFTLPAESEMARREIDQVASQTNDGNTDYVLAILGASQYFERSDAPPSCQTLVWFTDGAYDIDDASFASYTNLTSVDEIKSRFAAAVCGPVPPEFDLDEPLADKIRDLQFVVRMIDLRAGDQNQADRANTDPVLDRLLTGGEGECGINGTRIQATQTAELVDVFLEEARRLLEEAQRAFDETQREVGRSAVSCELLVQGVPASIVESVAVFVTPNDGAEIPSAEFLVGENVAASGDQSLQYEMSSANRSRSVPLSVRVAGGELASCFVRLSASIRAIGEPSLYAGASSTPAYLVVDAPDNASLPASGMGDEEVVLTVTFNGSPVLTTWDATSRQWVVELPTPSGVQAQLEVTGEFAGVYAGLGSIESFSDVIPVKDVPALPPVRWIGETTIEGTGTFSGRLEVSPSANVADEVCISLDAVSAPIRAADGSDLAVLKIQDDLTVCGPANEALDIDVVVEVQQSSNAVGTVGVGFNATFTPDGESSKQMGDGQVAFPDFTFARPIDSSTQWRLAALLALASAALTYLIMQGLTAMQAKLQAPSEMLMVRSSLHRDPSSGRLVRAGEDAPIRIAEMRQVVGSRRRYDLAEGLTLRRKMSLNPFRGLSAVVESKGPAVLAHPAAGAAAGNQRRVPVPLRFGRLVVVTVGDGNRIVALVPMATTPSATASIIDEGLRRLDSQIRDLTMSQGTDSSAPEVGAQSSAPSSFDDTQSAPSVSSGPPAPTHADPGRTPPPAPSPASTRKPPPPPHRR